MLTREPKWGQPLTYEQVLAECKAAFERIYKVQVPEAGANYEFLKVLASKICEFNLNWRCS